MVLFIKSLIFSVLFFNIALSQLQDFIGSDSCESCHPDQFELWKSSTHGPPYSGVGCRIYYGILFGYLLVKPLKNM